MGKETWASTPEDGESLVAEKQIDITIDLHDLEDIEEQVIEIAPINNENTLHNYKLDFLSILAYDIPSLFRIG